MRFIPLSIVFLSLSTFAAPKWVNSPMEFCPPTELCAVGEAAGALIAEMAARDSLAKIFQTKIQSDQSVVTTSTSKSDQHGLLSAGVDEETYQRIREFAEEVIQGAYIKERYESSEAHFALVALHKSKGAKIIEDKMSVIDENNRSLIKDGRRSSLNRIIKNLKVRDALHERYRILKTGTFSSPVSLSKVLRKKKEKRLLGVKVSLRVKELKKAKEIKKAVTKSLLDNDFILSKDRSTFVIKVTLEEERQYMKVKGFVKFKYLLQAKSYNSNSEEIGAVKYEIAQTGRTKVQAYNNAMPGLKKFIEEHFDELNID
ncbi:hypothetical protein A9Q84_09170 [Halobacteriovorax marinus]|uniref:Uncharacterized protein n=1 Tax=Halobacteriovorax marinus TaxID=97084 RepID=A0A1Y5FC17_9BACT|nr:hypothetical protein A9Q84_09170 [Halobacteriovorax marinus]